jgi:hypothetical protein
MNRFLLYLFGGFAVVVALAAVLAFVFWSEIEAQASAARISFLMSLAEDIVFFGLVGIAGLLLQLYSARGDLLRKRVQYVFANTAISYPALEYIENVVRRNAVFAEQAEHHLEVVEYRPELWAYRVLFHNRYVLRNMFGDIAYESEISVEVAPDLVRDGVKPLGVVSSIALTVGSGETREFVSKPTELTPAGFQRAISVDLPPNGKALYEMRWWSWVSNIGNSGFSLKRFSERTRITVENKSAFTVRVASGRGADVRALGFGQSAIVAEAKSVPDNVRLEFQWLPPLEHADEPDPSPGSTDLHPILSSQRRLGQPSKDGV